MAYDDNFKLERIPAELLASLQVQPRQGMRRYPFGEMEVGHSFSVNNGAEVGRVKNAARAWMQRYDVQFIFVPNGEGKTSVVRIR